MVTEKLINKFLIFLYDWHREEYGDSLAELENGGLHVLDKVFPNNHPEVIAKLSESATKDLTPNLATELKSRGLVDYENLVVTLTPEGFKRAKQLKYPARHFLSSYWKWYIPIAINVIAAFIAIARLTNCTPPT